MEKKNSAPKNGAEEKAFSELSPELNGAGESSAPDKSVESGFSGENSASASAVVSQAEQPGKKAKQKNMVSISVKSFISVLIIMYAIIFVVGILTYVIPSGNFTKIDGQVIAGTFKFEASTTRLPWYRWLTAPIEFLFMDSAISGLALQISAMLVILGGAFTVIEKTGGMHAIISLLIAKFSKHKFALVWILNLMFMLLASFFGIFEEALILLPILIMLSKAMGWDNSVSLMVCVLATAVGFSVALLNPLTIGTAARLSETSVYDGILYRIVLFAVLWVATSLFVVYSAKKIEAKNKLKENYEQDRAKFLKEYENIDSGKKRDIRIFVIFFAAMLAVLLIAYAVPVLQSFAMIILAVGFLFGAILAGSLASRNFVQTLKYFGKGCLSIAPAIYIVFMAMCVNYLAKSANILDTVIYYFSGALSSFSPYFAIILIYFCIMLLDFFITSGSGKAIMIIPLLTALPIPGISVQLIILAYVLGDGFTNAFFPTNGTLLIGLSMSDTSYGLWFKRTWMFQVFLLLFSVAALVIGVWIGI